MITNAYKELTIATRMPSAPIQRAHLSAPARLDTLVMVSLARVRAADSVETNSIQENSILRRYRSLRPLVLLNYLRVLLPLAVKLACRSYLIQFGLCGLI